MQLFYSFNWPLRLFIWSRHVLLGCCPVKATTPVCRAPHCFDGSRPGLSVDGGPVCLGGLWLLALPTWDAVAGLTMPPTSPANLSGCEAEKASRNGTLIRALKKGRISRSRGHHSVSHALDVFLRAHILRLLPVPGSVSTPDSGLISTRCGCNSPTILSTTNHLICSALP